MALKSTIFKASLQIADIDHGYYADHALTLARHPKRVIFPTDIRKVSIDRLPYKGSPVDKFRFKIAA